MAAILGPRVRRLAVFLLLAGVGAGVRATAAQSLADVAKKEEERRKTVTAPTRVYTNKDLTGAPAGSAPAAAATTAKPADAAAKDAADKAAKDKEAKEDDPSKDPAYWAGRLKALTDKLNRDTTFADALQTKINSLTTDFVNRDDPAQRAQVERDRQKAVADLARLNQEIAGGKKAIADLQEEARQAGVPPGWLR